MALVLSAAKVVLLAAHLAAQADIDNLASLAAQHSNVLRKVTLLRILLTYLPETVKPRIYAPFIEQLEGGELGEGDVSRIDISTVENLSEEEAAKKVRKLHLLPLSWPEAPAESAEDPVTLFLLRRAYRIDEEAGLLDQLPDLLVPFLGHSPYIRTLMVSAVLPLLRRNIEYYPENPLPHSLWEFQHLPDRTAVELLLSQTGVGAEGPSLVGRDLRGLVGPWLLNERRWKTRKHSNKADEPGGAQATEAEESLCPGWQEFLEWLTTQGGKSWRVAVSAVEQWDGPGDIDLGGYGVMWLNEQEQQHLESTYARAAIAAAYLVPDESVDALTGAHAIVAKITSLLDQDPVPALQTAASILSPLPDVGAAAIMTSRNVVYMRSDLLDESNPLTTPSNQATQLLHALVLSAYLLTRAGAPCTVRRAGELAFLQLEREQKADALKLLHQIGDNGPKSDEKYWIRARNEILWLRDWGAEEASGALGDKEARGVLGQLKREFLEVEILKALLANTRYSLAKSLYEDSPDRPLPKKLLQDTVFAAAMNAYDNANNPNRTKGRLKQCDDIIHAFPKTIEKSMFATQRVEALLRATHALSQYRLVLKQDDQPKSKDDGFFRPVVLRAHKDPISLIGKILEQNPKSYTRIQELLDLGTAMAEAGLTVRDKSGHTALTPEREPEERSKAEKRITAMCIDAALTEDDFETAYSYVVNRLSALTPSPSSAKPAFVDEWSWKAALQAGKYRRTERTTRPTHLGTASANPEIRHLEQRLECLATALRIAPPPTLQEILNAFRRAEEELESAIRAEQEQEDAWDTAGDMGLSGSTGSMPGAFGTPPPAAARKAHVGPRAGAGGGGKARDKGEDAPVSLFDLTRTSVVSAQRNFSALSSLQRLGSVKPFGDGGNNMTAAAPSSAGEGEDGQPKRLRKRDQLRDAAMGTLVSGVGWLINAPPVDRNRDSD